ncbi:MAG: hypothetical protein V7629_12950 [Motiliproteus sp.]
MKDDAGCRSRVTPSTWGRREFDSPAVRVLDSPGEQQEQEALAGQMVGWTLVIIAHRLSTVLSAERIALIDNGRQVAQDAHQPLL